jgi:regulator of Ty1 transposition protein 103
MAAAKSGVDVETRDGGGGSFSEERFVDKLNKLNNTTASIQSILSFPWLHLCVADLLPVTSCSS